MASISLFTSWLGFFCLYHTSQRLPQLKRDLVGEWLHQNAWVSKFTALAFLGISLLSACWLIGVGAGIFLWLIAIMTMGSVIILFAPLYLNYKVGLGLLFLLLILETTF